MKRQQEQQAPNYHNPTPPHALGPHPPQPSYPFGHGPAFAFAAQVHCIYPGCYKSTHPGSKFCSRSHRDIYNYSYNDGVDHGGGGGGGDFGHTPGLPAASYHRNYNKHLPGICNIKGCPRPVHPGSDYCSRTHLEQGKTDPSKNVTDFPVPRHSGGDSVPRDSGSDSVPRDSGGGDSSVDVFKENVCFRKGCTRPVATFDTGHKRMYCGKECVDRVRGGEPEKNLPTGSKPKIMRMDKDHPDAIVIAKQFQKQWKKSNNPVPKITTICRIINPPDVHQRFQAHRKNVIDTAPALFNEFASPGNCVRRWHGTRMTCKLGEAGHLNTCSDSNCIVCKILNVGFDMKYCKDKERYGKGLYFSGTSGKSNDYCHNSGCLLLCNVVAGRAFPAKDEWWEPRRKESIGYDSVVGQTGEKGGVLNYDEITTYSNDSAMPLYLVKYEWHKSQAGVCNPCKGKCWKPGPGRDATK